MKIINVKKIEDLCMQDLLDVHRANLDYSIQIKNIFECLKEPSKQEDIAMIVFTSYYQNLDDKTYVDMYPTFFFKKQFKKTSLDIQKSCDLEQTFVKSNLSNSTTVPEIKDENATVIISAHMYGYFIQVQYPAKEISFTNSLFDSLSTIVKAQILEDTLPSKEEKNKKHKI